MLTKLTTAALLAAAALPIAAQSTDFAAWNTHGDVLLGAPSTTATLSTAALLSGETPLSGTSALLFIDLEPAMGASFGADTFEGSGVLTSFAVQAGTRIDVSWTLATMDAVFADQAFVVVNGTASFLAAAAAAPTSGVFSYVFPNSGNASLGFAVLDVTDVVGVSTLALSNVTVTPIPEPGTLPLMAVGLAGLWVVARRRGAVAPG
jgi:hypothetical protein